MSVIVKIAARGWGSRLAAWSLAPLLLVIATVGWDVALATGPLNCNTYPVYTPCVDQGLSCAPGSAPYTDRADYCSGESAPSGGCKCTSSSQLAIAAQMAATTCDPSVNPVTPPLCTGEGASYSLLECQGTMTCDESEMSCVNPAEADVSAEQDECAPGPCGGQAADACDPTQIQNANGDPAAGEGMTCNSLGTDPIIVSSRAAITEPFADSTFDGPTPLKMSRSYRSNDRSVTAAYPSGPMGRGWRHEWESSLRCQGWGRGGNAGSGNGVVCVVSIGYTAGVRFRAFGDIQSATPAEFPGEQVQVFASDADPLSLGQSYSKMIRRIDADNKPEYVVYFVDGRKATFGSVCECGSTTDDYCRDPLDLQHPGGIARLKGLVDARGRVYRVHHDLANSVLVSVTDDWGHELALRSEQSCGQRVAKTLDFRESSSATWTTVASYTHSTSTPGGELLTAKAGDGSVLRSYTYGGVGGRLTAIQDGQGAAIVEFGYAGNGDANHIADEATDLDVIYTPDPVTPEATNAAYKAHAATMSSGTRTTGRGGRASRASGGITLEWLKKKLQCVDSGAVRIDWYTHDNYLRRTSHARYERPPPVNGVPQFSCSAGQPPPSTYLKDEEKYEYVEPQLIATALDFTGTNTFDVVLPLRTLAKVTRKSVTNPDPLARVQEYTVYAPAAVTGAPDGYSCGATSITEGRVPCVRGVDGYTLNVAGDLLHSNLATFFAYDTYGRLTRSIGPVDLEHVVSSDVVPVEVRTYWPIDDPSAAQRGRLKNVRRYISRSFGTSALAGSDATAAALGYSITYDIFGPYVVTDPAGNQTKFLRDGGPQVRWRIGPDGSRLRISYYDVDKPSLLYFEATGTARRASYDSRGRLASIERLHGDPESNPASVTLGDKQSVAYDVAGNPGIATRTNSAGVNRWTRDRVYNGDHQLRSELHPDYPDDRNKDAIWNYDPSGFLTTMLDHEGRRTEFVPDVFGRPASVTRKTSATDSTQLSNLVASYGYAPGTDAIQSVADGAGRTTSYTRDDFGRITKVENLATILEGGSWRYEYDASGSVRLRKGGRTSVGWIYDGLGRPLALYATSTESAAVDFSFAWDAPGQEGRLSSISQAGRTTTYTWDAAGRLRFERVSVSGVGTPLVTEYLHDADGFLDSIVYPSGLSVTYDRDDATKEVTAVRETGFNRPFVTELAREPFGPVKSGFFGNGLPFNQTFDLRYQPVSVQSGPVSLMYGMSLAGDVGGISQGATSSGFTYDHLDRLKTFAPDHATGESLRYEYVGDRLIAAWTMGASPVRRMAFGYDYQSNLSSVSTYDASGTSIVKTVCLVHDALGRLVLVGEGSGSSGGPDALTCRTESEVTQVVARFGYDAMNRRVSRTDASGTTYFAFLPGGETLGEYRLASGAWQPVREYVWLDGRPVAQEEHPSASERYTYFVHVDHIGLPRALTNQGGQEVWRATSRPYGDIEETSFTDPLSGRAVVTNLRLPGQYDERLFAAAGISGLAGPYYNWNRWYLPSVGRYLELDPIAKAGGFNGFYGPNWYGYAEGNPLTYSDSRGLYSCTYHVTTHTMSCVSNDPESPHTGFYSDDFISGNNSIPGCKNNPLCDTWQDVGPIPEGVYLIGPKRSNGRRDYTPWIQPDPNSWKRYGFQMHSCGSLNAPNCSTGCTSTTESNMKDLNRMLDLEDYNWLTVVP